MKIRILICLLLIWTGKVCLAQPGGGGGILIENVVDKYQAVISIDDPALKVRTFFLCDTAGPSIKEYGPQERAGLYQYANRSPDRLYIPPYIHVNHIEKEIPDQFVQFIYRGDTTCIEFRDIPQARGSGVAYQMEALQLIPGNFRYYCEPYKRYGYPEESAPPEAGKTMGEALKLRSQGFTYTTFPALQSLSLAELLAGRLRPVVYAKPGNSFDTAWLLHQPLYRVDTEHVRIGEKILTMDIDDFPLAENGTQVYRLLLPYLSADRLNARDVAGQKGTRSIHEALAKKELQINGMPYTGILKVFYPFSGFRPGAGQTAGYHLKVYFFRNGRLYDTLESPDMDIDTEEPVIRPA